MVEIFNKMKERNELEYELSLNNKKLKKKKGTKLKVFSSPKKTRSYSRNGLYFSYFVAFRLRLYTCCCLLLIAVSNLMWLVAAIGRPFLIVNSEEMSVVLRNKLESVIKWSRVSCPMLN